MRVAHNIMAMNAHRNLGMTHRNLGKSLSRLSSGFRINSAADDAGGLAITEKLRAQVSGLEVAVSNAQDGISLIQTAEGALDRDHAILRRVRDLTEMAANGDKTDADREHYQAEVDALLDEIDRISATTEYNTKKLLDGTIGSKAAEKADSDSINSDSALVVDGIIRTTGEYKVSVLQEATKATAYIAGNTLINTVAPDQAGGLYAFMGGNTSQAGDYTFKIHQEGNVSLATVTALANAGDSMTDAVRKINAALEESGIKAKAYYNETGDLPYAAGYSANNTLAMINIESTEFGSKHEIHVELSKQPVGGGFTETNRNAASGTTFALYNSDLTDADGKLGNTFNLGGTGMNGYWMSERTAATDGWREDLVGLDPQIQITTRDGGTYIVSVGADIVTTMTNIETGTGNVVSVTWDEQLGTLNLVDSSSGSENFKVENYDPISSSNTDVGWANWLGIYGQVYGNEIKGKRVSRVRDYVLQVEDPAGNTGIIRARLGDRSSFFASQETTSAVLSSGVDPDSGGEITAGPGGIAGISFKLEDIQMVEGQSQFSVLASAGSLTLQIGPNEGADHRMTVNVDDMSVTGIGLTEDLDISTQRAAMALMDTTLVDIAINRVSTQRARLGALQNRLEHTVKNLGVTRENLQGSESRIRDADMAAEMMDFTKSQILLQAGTAMMAQANQVPQSVLQLLGG